MDFYQYACGAWIKNNPIPADQARWGRFTELEERNREILHQILEAAAKPAAQRDATTQKIGDYYAACMDVPAIDARGLTPLQTELNRIRDLSDKSQLAAEVAHLHRGGMSTVFEFGSGQDFKNSSEVIAQADQGGLGLPDRDYYLKTDAKSAEIRDKYVAHVQRMFELAGEPADHAKADAADCHENRDRPGQRLARPRFAARSREGVPPDEQAGTGGPQSRVPLEPILHR